ncbi:hypothetical protein R1sor_013539 [Riccia sorocarpa]|uniref:Uncharacterized protein n=1 Tax=Riccia sorocarpa TaxID=122646 RepID=A0ABD3HAF5_9MARC
MAPDKDQAEDNAESEYISDNWWEELEENDPETTRILRKLRSKRKALLRRIGGKLTSDEKIVTTCDEMRLRSRHVGELVKGASNLKTFEVSGSSDPSKFNEQGIAERFPLELAAIASSLQGHKHPTLTNLVAWPVNDLTNDVVKIISSAPHLSDLELVGPCSMDETTKVVLCAALKECSDLKRVYLRNSSEGILEVLAKVYGQRFSDPQVSVLESLTLEWPRGLAGLACLASSNISSLEIQLGNSGEHHCSLEEWQRVGRSLVRHPTLRVFKIQIIVYNREEVILHSIQLRKELAELWKASRNSPLLDIRVKILTRLFDKDVVFLQDALKDTYLKEIDLSGVKNSPQVFKSFAEMVGANTSVRSLRLLFQGVDGTEMSPTVLEDFWGHLFHHLRENTSIRILALTYSKGLNEENFRDLMDLLQVNFILRDVKLKHTQWGRDGKSALVQAALERNAKLAGYFSVLGAAQLSFDGAKAGRIFLCGLPFAGKTQLKVTMMECLGKTSRSESLTWSKIKETVVRWVPALRRTEGIEVELFYDKEAMTISIWDFAGQQIFRPLQNILFPKISQACVFLFVFNPFNKVDEKIIRLKENVHDAFADELRSWLRFIVSNTQITGRIRPQVIVVITHKDKLENRDMRLLSLPELEKIVKKLQREFEEVVELCPEGSGKEGKLVYHINATLKEDLEPIKNLVISSMKDVLSKKSPKIPRVCSELVSHLLKRPTDIQNKPLWPCEELYEFCSSNSELLSHIDVTEKERGKVLHAIASYMHDAGAVCMTPRALMEHVGNSDDGSNSVYDSDASDDGSNSVYDSDGSDDGSSPVYDSDGGSNSGYDSDGSDDDSDNSDTDCKKLAVVDLNWLTQKLLGQLITIGHSTQMIQDGVHADGLLNTQQLKGVLDGVLSLQKDKDVDSQMVKELLLELDLCYCLERVTETKAKTNRYFFMPMLFGEESTVSTSEQVYQPLSWVVKMPQGSGYFGYRIQCRDTDRTSLSPAFYPRFQIHLRKRMGATLGVNDDNFIFARSHVDIRVDGYSIFVETDKSSENHVDVLVNFCKTKTRDQAVQFIRSHILNRLFKFCASEKGCPGVELVVASNSY